MTLIHPFPMDDRLPSADELICDDGEPMESDRHRDQMNLLIDSLKHAWRDRTDFYVSGNMFLYFSAAQVRSNDFRGPDVFVVMNTTRRERKAWVLWEEDWRAPDLVIELLSDTTEHVDRGEKMDIYAKQLRVPEYVLFDPFSGVLEGYELDETHGVYVPKMPRLGGRIHCAQLGLSLAKVRTTFYGVEADWLRWIGPDGRVLPVFPEYSDAAEERIDLADDRADAAEDRADAAEDRADAAARRVEIAEQDADLARRCGQELLLRLLPVKFGALSEQVQARIAQASIAQLQHWAGHLPSAGTLQDIFGDE